MSKKWIVYRAVSPSGKCYVGITSQSLQNRKSKHLSDADNPKRCHTFQFALKKYGDQIKWEVLEKVNNVQCAYTKEKEYIQKFNSYNDGYNETLGGDGGLGYKHTEQTKIKMSEIKKGKPKHPNTQRAFEKMMRECPPMKGKRHSKETRAKLSKLAKERGGFPKQASINSSNSISRAIICYDKDDVFIAEFKNAAAAYKWLGKKVTGGIAACCRGHKYRKTAYGYKWKFKESN